MRTLLGPSVVGAMLMFQGSAAWAQTPYPECSAEPTDGDVAAAKGAFQAGQASFNEADYGRAIDYWEDAYRRDCTAHALLLNLARAYELNGDKRQAVEALRTFLARKPESPQKDQIQRRIEVLNQQIDAEPPPTAAPPPAEDKSKEEQPKQPERSQTTKQQPAEPKPEPDSNHWVGPVILGGVGVAAVTTGIIVHTIGSSDEQAAEDACPSRLQCDPAIEEKGNSGIFKQKLGVGLIIGGAAAIGGGIAWYFLTAPDASASTPRDASAKPRAHWHLLPEAGVGYAGLTAVGSF